MAGLGSDSRFFFVRWGLILVFAIAVAAPRAGAQTYTYKPTPVDQCFNYNSLLSSDTSSGAQLASYVSSVRARHGGENVSIVAHSNGGLVSRAFRVFNGGSSQMRRFVTLGTPHSGTTSAWACVSPACFDMRAGSLFLLSLAGRGCDRSLWSSVDGVILPASSARCGSSTQVASVDHLTLLTNTSVYNSVRAALR